MLNKTIFIGLLLCLSSSILLSQIQYKLSLLEDNATYQVSMIPLETWQSPYNLTSTAQVTIKVPTSQFQVINLMSLQNNVIWEANSRIDAPEEAPGSDYISFGLTSLGTSGLAFSAGEEVLLFTFQNASGCVGPVSLFDNNSDPFLAPNSRQANVGNQMTTLGARGEAYIGTAGASTVDCMTTSSFELLDGLSEVQSFPNPANDFLQLRFHWDRSAEKGGVLLYDINGKQLLSQETTFKNGNNSIELAVQHLPAGTYELYLQGSDWKYALKKIVVSHH